MDCIISTKHYPTIHEITAYAVMTEGVKQLLSIQTGYRCDLYETVAQPQGLNVLNDLGILTETLQQSSQIDTLYGQNSKGTGRST